jgi:hypothetical protein
MLLAIALLGHALILQPANLIHPQLASNLNFSAEKSEPVKDARLSSTVWVAEDSFPLTMVASAQPETLAMAAPAEPEADPIAEELPFAPVPSALLSSPAAFAFVKPAKPMTVSVAALREEDRRNRRLWMGLAIASHSAATFDAWSTRHAITTYGAQELNPMLRPFAGNASLYVAIQVAPTLLDFAGRKMMYSKYSWVRRAWWVPQSASFVSSIFCGAHNLSVH